MKLTSGLILSAALLGFVACSDADKGTSEKAATAAPITTQAAAPGNAAGAVAVNPPHGQPGHRCDLQVGAPLNAPAAPNLQMPSIQPLPAQPAQQAAGSLAAGTNPPHGEAGHDCSIPVGAPLNK